MGITTGTAFAPSSPRIAPTTPWKSAPILSILFTKAIRGTEYLSACLQTVSDWGCTPPTAQKRAIAPSSTRRLRSTSTVKSTCPGVSIRFTMCPRQTKVVAALVIVIPRSCSWSIQSITARPSWTSPMRWVLPVKKSIRSDTVVFPASMWAIIPMFRRLPGGNSLFTSSSVDASVWLLSRREAAI